VEFYDVVKRRFSVRAFEDKPVEEDKLSRILNAARLAPSARNLQECRFVVVTDKEKIRQMADAAFGQKFVGQAPVVIACCSVADRGTMKCGHTRYTIDAGIALEHIALAAAAEGLGGCWIGSFKPENVRRILQIPDSVEVVELYPLGYAAPNEKPGRGRKPLEEVACFNTWTLKQE
jgi:nitroreductase